MHLLHFSAFGAFLSIRISLSSLHLTKETWFFPIFLVHQPDLLMQFNIHINVMQTTYFPSLVNILGHPVDLAVYPHWTWQRPKIIFDIFKCVSKCWVNSGYCKKKIKSIHVYLSKTVISSMSKSFKAPYYTCLYMCVSNMYTLTGTVVR